MKVKKFVKLTRNDEGSGLVLALMTLMVLSVLGAALGAITIGSFKLGDINRDDNSAYYIAEAGANMAYDELQIKVNDTYNKPHTEDGFHLTNDTFVKDNFKPKIYDAFDPQFGEDPEASVTIEIIDNENSKDYQITSIGKIGQRTRTVEKNVTVTWSDNSNGGIGSSFPDITTTVAKSKMTIDNGVELTGAVHIDSEAPNSLFIGNKVVMDSIVYMHPNADKETSIDWQNEKQSGVTVENRAEPLDWEVYEKLLLSFPTFPDASVSDEWSNVIETNGGVKNFVFDDLSLNEDLQIIGGGRVNIFVKNSLSMGEANINLNGNADQLQIYYSGNASVNIYKSNFKGSLFLKQSDLLVSNHPLLNGLIISGGDIVNLGGGVILDALIIAPNASVTLSNSSNNNSIQGIIIGDKVHLVNNLKLDFDDYYLENFPLKLPDPESDGSGSGEGTEGDSGSGSGGGDLITTEPGIEN